jgi:GT2 family glycosyltransferase
VNIAVDGSNLRLSAYHALIMDVSLQSIAGSSRTMAGVDSARPHAEAIPSTPPAARVRTAGKFFIADQKKFFLKGVTYGPFNPIWHGSDYHAPATVEHDFSMMAAHGINAVRTYTAPPRWLLDIAARQGIGVMAGIPWTQHVAFLDHKEHIQHSYRLVHDAMDRLGAHPALLAIAVGNEIPAQVVRWYGHRRIEKHLEKLARIVKQEDPATLVTYANYPTTEYLELPFLDFVSFNVYLDAPDRFDAYLPRLQNLAGERPLILSEIGVDSVRHGKPAQAEMLVQKINAVFAGGAAGMFTFSWTDEWFRNGCEIGEWKFGLVDRHRKPRVALDAVHTSYRQIPAPPPKMAPRVAVIVCSFNGAGTISQTLSESLKLDYPNFEVIVVDDGSTEDVSHISAKYPVKLIRQNHMGLSAARNTGLYTTTADIVAYIDDDAYPDPSWLTYLVRAMQHGNRVGAGGPNLYVPEDGETAECVAHAPGGPTHVLLDDAVAEHIPGCNMAFYRDALLQIGGFDPQFRIAGDDVDICWRLQNAGGVLAFAPAAQVWHHRRNSIGKYWKQQVNYGKAEADLERKWPNKYNPVGHTAWAGRVYGKGAMQALPGSQRRIYHGVWGGAIFQQTQHIPLSTLASLPMMPEWYVILALLTTLFCLGWIWHPLLLAGPLLLSALLFAWVQAIDHARRAVLLSHRQSIMQRIRMRATIALLYRMQPLARFIGRYGRGLTPWRLRGIAGFVPPLPGEIQIVQQKWKLASQWLQLAESQLETARAIVLRGSDFDRWDLEIRGGLFASVRVKLMTEDIGDEKQIVRWRTTPHYPFLLKLLVLTVATASLAAAAEGHYRLAMIFAMLCLSTVAMAGRACGAAMATFKNRCVGDSAC